MGPHGHMGSLMPPLNSALDPATSGPLHKKDNLPYPGGNGNQFDIMERGSNQPGVPQYPYYEEDAMAPYARPGPDT